MEIILLKEVPHLGHAGEIVNVKSGYARNYLLPKQIAVMKTKTSLKRLEQQKQDFAKLMTERNESYQKTIDLINSVDTLNIQMKSGSEDKLYGAITSAAIVDLLKQDHDITLDKKQLQLRRPIKMLGEHIIMITLNKDHKIQLKLNVTRIETQKKDKKSAFKQDESDTSTASSDESSSESASSFPTSDQDEKNASLNQVDTAADTS